jgi:17beta-estradiol 17-dehydrogenase / very-long-chain 3-oxoacyl-CoA reductase
MESLFNQNGAKLLQYIGSAFVIYTTLKYAFKIVNNVRTFVLNSGQVNFKKYGSWAVVTGCTDGIGKSYTELLAKQGLNIVLISRSIDKLQELSNYLTQKYSIETKIIAADFTGYY